MTLANNIFNFYDVFDFDYYFHIYNRFYWQQLCTAMKWVN